MFCRRCSIDFQNYCLRVFEFESLQIHTKINFFCFFHFTFACIFNLSSLSLFLIIDLWFCLFSLIWCFFLRSWLHSIFSAHSHCAHFHVFWNQARLFFIIISDSFSCFISDSFFPDLIFELFPELIPWLIQSQFLSQGAPIL